VSTAPRIAVVTFPGSNDDGDAMLALELLGAEPVRAWHADVALPDGTAGVVLPGGFSYGDYLRCGANRGQQFLCADVTVRVESTTSAFAGAWEVGQELVIPIKHGEGSWFGDDDLVAALEDGEQVAFRYLDDVNGAVGRIAGVTNEAGNVLGLMPHPEHAVEELLGPTGGVPVLAGLIEAALIPARVG
jgi:phosphoribosylformylglycinamidine (FGAM) synthase-like amidotransferase family enzyme